MITFNKYLNKEDHTWYDSTNIVYSKCYDTQNNDNKTLKIVFKGGRTYLYKDVDSGDYIQFKMAESNGSAFTKHIRPYKCERIEDTSLDKLNELKEELQKEDNLLNEKKLGEILYNIQYNKETNEFSLQYDGKTLFSGIENNFSLLKLLTSLNIKYTIENIETITNNSDELLNEIKFN